MSQGQAKQKTGELIKKYEEVLKSGRDKKYTEEETKKDFILPLFEALGWDVSSKKEVSAEEHIKSAGRVDYGFYLNGMAKFYLEAKKLLTDLDDPEYAKQAIKYAWNRGVNWAVLTNFEVIKVFNAQIISKELLAKKVFELSCGDYLEKFEKLKLLCRDAFENNELDKHAQETGKAYKRLSVTEKLSDDLNKCRKLLTDSFMSWNKDKVSEDLIDEGVQKLLDRLIFIKVAEDRGIEPPTLQPLLREWQGGDRKIPLFRSMISKFRELDETYDSNLFQEHSFEKWDDYDNATEGVIKVLYAKHDDFEYDFKIIPADVLGAVYENYLGYKLEKAKKTATISKDSKKRKEQGIYYTPTFIVDYIVRNALRPVLDRCRSIDDLKKIKVLDPACGSGSFLIKALGVICEKYKEFNRPIDIHAKVQILQENIYGVDLDEQAVEIARLNLLINCLDKRIKLPMLDKNIKNGNSLISGTDEELKKYFGKNYRDKKPFNWQEEFPEVFKQGGFDVIIGNPPYVNLANIKDAREREYLKHEYETAKNKSDLYSFFTERGISLLKDGGILGFIFSNSWLGTDSFSRFREFLIKNTTILQLVKLPPAVFSGATVTTVLIFLKKQKPPQDCAIPLFEYRDGAFTELPRKLIYERIKNSPGFGFSFEPELDFEIPTIKLGKVVKFSLGIKTSDDKRFISDEKKDDNSYRLLRGKDVRRYNYTYAGKWIWYKPDLMMQKVGAGPRKLEYFLTDKILIKDVAQEIVATYDAEKYLTTDTLSLIYEARGYNPKFILGLLNSRLINKWFKTHFPAGLHIKINQMENIPIPEVGKKNQIKLVSLVDNILQLSKKLIVAEENSNEWERLKSEIEKIDKKIDEEVYKLYSLTPVEIKIVGKNLIFLHTTIK